MSHDEEDGNTNFFLLWKESVRRSERTNLYDFICFDCTMDN